MEQSAMWAREAYRLFQHEWNELDSCLRTWESDFTSNPPGHTEYAPVLSVLEQWRGSMGILKGQMERFDIPTAVETVDWVIDTTKRLHGLYSPSPRAQQILDSQLQLLLAGQTYLERFVRQMPGALPAAFDENLIKVCPPDSGPQVMQVSSEIVYQLYSQLFPEERLYVVAGRRVEERVIRISATFEVTGDGSAVGVKSDPELLTLALLAMYHTGAFVAWWAHSHPGVGPGATGPSPTDKREHQEWLLSYSRYIVGLIMVKDGYFRLFGDAIDNGGAQIRWEGEGIEEVEEHVFRIDI